MQINVRKSYESDMGAIRRVVGAAFGKEEGPEIVNLIFDLLIDPSASPCLSLVAITDNDIVGHIVLSHAEVKHPHRVTAAAILAPLCVHPLVQLRGIGGRLISAGMQAVENLDAELVFVLGHPSYYPRHGFQRAGALGFEAPYSIPVEHASAWMVQTVRSDIPPETLGGKVICADALRDPKYWRE
jgi:predicted N-acetyltransferase YhbS